MTCIILMPVIVHDLTNIITSLWYCMTLNMSPPVPHYLSFTWQNITHQPCIVANKELGKLSIGKSAAQVVNSSAPESHIHGLDWGYVNCFWLDGSQIMQGWHILFCTAWWFTYNQPKTSLLPHSKGMLSFVQEGDDLFCSQIFFCASRKYKSIYTERVTDWN